jgi:hypothetical protein
VLRGLGADEAAFQGLQALRPRERTALVAGSIERLDPIDLQLVLGTDAAGAHRLLRQARQRYLAAVLATQSTREPGADAPGRGELATLIDETASRAMGEQGPER